MSAVFSSDFAAVEAAVLQLYFPLYFFAGRTGSTAAAISAAVSSSGKVFPFFWLENLHFSLAATAAAAAAADVFPPHRHHLLSARLTGDFS